LRRQCQETTDPALKAEVNRLQKSVTHRLYEWRNDVWSSTLENLDPENQSLWRMTERVNRIPTPSPPLVTLGGLALSDREKAEALVDSLEAQFQPVSVPADPATIEVVDMSLRAHLFAPASEPILTNPDEVQEAFRGLKLGKTPGPEGIPNRTLKHLLLRAIPSSSRSSILSSPSCIF
jgi:hypothetical protein